LEEFLRDLKSVVPWQLHRCLGGREKEGAASKKLHIKLQRKSKNKFNFRDAVVNQNVRKGQRQSEVGVHFKMKHEKDHKGKETKVLMERDANGDFIFPGQRSEETPAT